MINCPNCKSSVTELLACDVCNTIGCIRCVTRFNKQWLCKNCRTETKTAQTAESALADMFG